MTNSMGKKLLAAVASVAVVATAVVGMSLATNDSKNPDTVLTGVVSHNGYGAYAEGDEVTLDGVNKTLIYVEKDSELANTLIYGTTTKGTAYLGPAAYFSLFGNEVNIGGSSGGGFADVQGRVAADKFTLINYSNSGYSIHGSINSTSDVNATNKNSAVLIANNDGMTFGNVATKYGKFVVSDASSIVGETASNGTIYYNEDGIIDFADEMARLAAKSKQLANLPVKTTISDDCVTLTGTDDKLNVFTFTADQWSTAVTKTLKIKVPSSSYVVINVPGSNPTVYAKDIQWNGSQIGQDGSVNSHLMFNYFEATSLTLTQGNYTRGCTLAPLATVDTGVVNTNPHNFGQIIANKITIHREQGYFSFDMPTSYIEEYIAENGENINENYVAHFVYWDPVAKAYKEVNNGSVYIPGSLTDLTNAFQAGDTLELLSGDDVATASGIDAYKGSVITWNVYTDGTNITKQLSGDKIVDVKNYANYGLTKGTDMTQGDTYTFQSEVVDEETVSTNVYFVANAVYNFEYEVELNYADNNNENNTRTDVTVFINSTIDDKYDIEVTFPANSETTASTTTIDGVTVDVATMNNTGVIEAGLPVFDGNGDVIDYTNAYEAMVYSGSADSYREYKQADTDISDGKVAIYLEDVTVDMTIDLSIIDNEKVTRPGSFEVTIYDADGNPVDTVVIDVSEDSELDSIDGYTAEQYTTVCDVDLPMFDDEGNKIDYSDYSAVIELDGTEYQLYGKVEFDSATNTFDIVVLNLKVDCVVDVVVEDDRFGDEFTDAEIKLTQNGLTIDEDALADGESMTNTVPVFDEEGNLFTYDVDAVAPEGFVVKEIRETTEDDGTVKYTVVFESTRLDAYAKVEYIGGSPSGQTSVGIDFNGAAVEDGITTDITKIAQGLPAGTYGTDLVSVNTIPEGFVVKEIKVETTTDASQTGYAGDVVYTVVLQGSVAEAYGKVVFDGDTPSGNADVTVELNGSSANITTNNTLISDSISIYDENGNSIEYTPDDLKVTGLPSGYQVKEITVTTDDEGNVFYTVTVTNKFAVTVLKPNGTVISEGYYKTGTYVNNPYNLASSAGVSSVPNGYKWEIIDVDTGAVHSKNNNIVALDRDLTLQYVIVKNDSVSPRIYFNMIRYKQSYFIRGSVMKSLMNYYGITEEFILSSSIESLDALGADKKNNYFMFSMVLGVDNDNVSKTRFTISTESLASKNYIYDGEQAHTTELPALIAKFCAFGVNHSAGLEGNALLGDDPFLNDYDGYRQVRIVLPADEYANKTLYVNAYYYDENNNEYLHGNYVLDMANNPFWTLS